MEHGEWLLPDDREIDLDELHQTLARLETRMEAIQRDTERIYMFVVGIISGAIFILFVGVLAA